MELGREKSASGPTTEDQDTVRDDAPTLFLPLTPGQAFALYKLAALGCAKGNSADLAPINLAAAQVALKRLELMAKGDRSQ